MLTDSPQAMRDKIRTAVTDSQSDITYDPIKRPGVSNLLAIQAGLTDVEPQRIAEQLQGKTMRDLKTRVADTLEPILVRFQQEYERIKADKGYLDEVEKAGRVKATAQAAATMERVRKAVGLDYGA